MVGKAVEIKERMQKTSAFFWQLFGISTRPQTSPNFPPANIIPVFQTFSTANSTAPAFISAKMFSPIVNNCPLEISPSPPEEWG